MEQKTKLYKKLHRWPGLILSFILMYYGITGIFMNHRQLLSPIDLPRTILPGGYAYQNWNNSALKGNLVIDPDSILVFGSIGIWGTDSALSRYSSMNAGFPEGMDNRRINDVHRSADGELYTATLFGLYAWSREQKRWRKFDLGSDDGRFVGIESVGDTIYALSRSFLFKGKSEGINSRFTRVGLAAPEGYVNRTGLFETIWQTHSGEIFGLPGKLVVDFLGLVTIFLSGTGIIYFFFPGWIKRRKKADRPVSTITTVNRWSLKWHNRTGAWFYLPLVLLFFTGMFLRPPLLIAIANVHVRPLKYSALDQPNPWHDKLRDMLYDEAKARFLLSTSDGMYYMESGRNTRSVQPVRFDIQPPVSVMGINTFEPMQNGVFLIGSFSGLFLWDPSSPTIVNYARGTVWEPRLSGRPIGDYKVTGTVTDASGHRYMIDYDRGVVPLWHNKIYPPMPDNILKESGMSLWSFSLEVHTGRIFEGMLGSFYILLVPLSGLAGITVVISGYLLWRKRYRRK